MTEAQASKFNK